MKSYSAGLHVLFILLCIQLSTLTLSAQADSSSYPLDPLTAAEIKKVVSVLEKNKVTSSKIFFNIINLKEPPKKEVLAFHPGDAFRREAFASFYDFAKPGITEAIVDLKTEKVISVKNLPNVTGMGLEADSIGSDIVRKDMGWVKALKKRGLSIDSVTHRSIFAGDLGLAPVGHREQIVIARRKGNKIDVEGLMAYTDFTSGKVLKIVDEENRFSGQIDLNYFDKDSIEEGPGDAHPVMVSQPAGSSFRLQGHEIISPDWHIRFGIDNREGLVIYDVRFNDKGKERKVMYRGSMPEMVVPYGGPGLLQAAYNFFDAGEYRMGQATAKSLTPGADAPENAVYVPATLHKENGSPYQVDRAVAVYDEYGGTLWRHGTVSRRATNLAITYYTQIENYDYGFTWRFKQDGTIDVDVALTGIVEIQGVHRTDAMDEPDNNDHSYQGLTFGTLVHPHVEAINHQHFFVFRLDMDIDGSENNSVMEMNTMLVPPGKMNPYSNAIVVKPDLLKTEKEGQRNINYLSNRDWHIVNNQIHNSLGQHVGYMLMPGVQAKTFIPEGALLRKKAGFLNNQVWVTKYTDGEIFPAGMYPASNKVYDGLPQWSAKNRPIGNNDIVVWYVAGITHIVRPEEWPIMPTHHMGFSLMPFGFFSENPTMNASNPSYLKDKFPDIEKKQVSGDPDIEHY